MTFQFLKLIEPQHEDSAINMYYFDMNHTLAEIKQIQKHKKIVLYGCGARAFICLKVLEEHGLRPDFFCENRSRLFTSELDGIKIVPEWNVIKNPDQYYIIITSAAPHFMQPIMHQLIRNKITEFGVLIESNRDYCVDLNYDCNKHKNNAAIYLRSLEKAMKNYIGNDYRRVNFQAFMSWMTVPNWWFHSFELITDYVAKNYGGGGGLCALDIGCGTGGLDYALMEKIDVVFDFITYEDHFVKDFQNVVKNVWSLNIETDDVPTKEKYDMIILTEVMEHFNYHPVDTLIKIKKLLNPDGFLFISVPRDQPFTPYYRSWKDMPSIDDKILIPDYFHNYMYKPEELREIFSLAGYEIVLEDLSPDTLPVKYYYILK
jgi:SAM-dependent methyltransferase